jgi:hypothetical protein
MDFLTWKAHRANSLRDRRGNDNVYDPSHEELPDKLWFALNHQQLQQKIRKICLKIGNALRNRTSDDQEIVDLIEALEAAKSTPHIKEIRIAVVGEQGIGKSSTINAVLNRDVVDVSAHAHACTTFATIIIYKEGAADNTTSSDVKIEFLNEVELREFIEEQIRRYAEVHSFSSLDDQMSDEEDDLGITDSSDEETLQSDARHGRRNRRNISREEQSRAETAKEFFEIIFDTEGNPSARQELQEWLNEADIEDGRFLDHCVNTARTRLAQTGALDGALNYTNVEDTDLQDKRDIAAKLWPLVKAITIATGSILLRHGIYFLDLPGRLS